METTKIIVAGSRDFNDVELMRSELNSFVKELGTKSIEVVSGGARGADHLGEHYAKHYNQACSVFPADWKQYGKRAGYIRNAEMAKYAEACIVFWDGKSKGTKHMIDLAKRYGIILKVVNY